MRAAMTPSQIRRELDRRTEAAARRAKVAPFESAGRHHLLGLHASPSRFTGVDVGAEVVLTCDGAWTMGAPPARM